MHCLPVRRNVVVKDSVLDGPRSVVVHEARNRMWAQMAVLYRLLRPQPNPSPEGEGLEEGVFLPSPSGEGPGVRSRRKKR
jgi:hypothetical protein